MLSNYTITIYIFSHSTLNKDELQSACQYKTKDNNWVKPDWVETSHTYKPFYNGPPTTNVAVLANANHFTQEKNNAENAISIATMKWGLLPSKVHFFKSFLMSSRITKKILDTQRRSKNFTYT